MPQGADCNVVDECKRSPLHLATSNKCQLGVCQLLVQDMRAVGEPDALGRTALHYASMADPTSEVVQLLLKNV